MSVTQISSKDAIGKIVAKIHYDYDGIIIRFEDNTFAYINISCEDSYACLQEYDFDWKFHGYGAIQSGVITREEYEEYRVEQDRIRQQKQEEDERKLYEQLKQKFGDG